MGAEKEEKDTLIATYMHLTKEVLPSMARSDRTNWPVSEDHCFQRIILDHVCGGVWYEHLDRPAYKTLQTRKQNRCKALPRYCRWASRPRTAKQAIPDLAGEAKSLGLNIS